MQSRLSRSIVILAALLASCGEEPATGARRISEWGLFDDPATHDPVDGVEPYELVAPLFSDYASKHRFIRLPEGETIAVSENGYWQFPVGTVLVKTFSFPIDMRDPSLGERIVETRLLIHDEDRWRPEVYIWNDDATEAFLTPAGRIVPVELIDAEGETISFDYRVPSHTQCRNCHGGDDPVRPLGPRTGQLDRMHAYGPDAEQNQIDHLVELGWLDARPPADHPIVPYEPLLDGEPHTFEELDPAARSYLFANCSHCHSAAGAAHQSGLFLEIETPASFRTGLCKEIIAGECEYGSVVIRPGDPTDSVMHCRMASTEAGVRMPELPSVLVHTEGLGLIERWIAAMPADYCETTAR